MKALLRSAVAASLLLAQDPASAATRFEFIADAPNYSYAGSMLLEGTRSRIDITSGNHPLFNANITLITRGEETWVIDHGRRTYFHRRLPPEMRGPLSTVSGIGETTTASGLHITSSRQRVVRLGGARDRYAIHARYALEMEVEGETLEGNVTMEIDLEVDPRLPQSAFPHGLQYAARTGLPRVDGALARRIPDRLPLRQSVTASRQLAGGPVVTETFLVVVSNVRQETAVDTVFYPPAGYTYEEPVFRFGH